MNNTQNLDLDRDTIKAVSEITYLQMRDDITNILSQKKKGEFTIQYEVNCWNRGIGKTIGLLRVAKEINAIVFNNVDKISLMETYQSLGFGELPELGVLKNREVLNKNYEIALVDEGIYRNETIYNIIKLMYPVVIRIDNSYLFKNTCNNTINKNKEKESSPLTINIGKMDTDNLKTLEEKTFDEIKEICQPIVDYLKTRFNQHYSVVITNEQIKIVSDELCIPIKTIL